MISSYQNIQWLFLDHTDTLEREQSGSFSIFERKGERVLTKLPYCPVCRHQVWLHSVTYMQQVNFTGLLVGDAAWDNGMTYIVSERFKDHWQKSDLKGLSFSNEPVKVSFKRKTVFLPPSKVFFIALPEPRLIRFDVKANALYAKTPRCKICSPAEVKRVDKLIFDEDTVDGLDCFLPSCLPGWTVVSTRFREFIEQCKLMNFNFLEGFERMEDRSLIRKGYWKQKPDGLFDYIA